MIHSSLMIACLLIISHFLLALFAAHASAPTRSFQIACATKDFPKALDFLGDPTFEPGSAAAFVAVISAVKAGEKELFTKLINDERISAHLKQPSSLIPIMKLDSAYFKELLQVIELEPGVLEALSQCALDYEDPELSAFLHELI